MKCFYHNDMDGHCSGAIVKRYWGQCDSDGMGEHYIEIDYKDEFPINTIGPDEMVFIVDFSLQKPGDWQRLLAITCNITWIDHHKTAIERSLKIPGVDGLDGIREEGEAAACLLAWQYFFPEEPIPVIVTLLSDYDTWTFKHGEYTRLVQEGIKLEKTHPESFLWNLWFDPDHDLSELRHNGEVAIRYRDSYYQKLVKSFSFLTSLNGHSCIACNAGAIGSPLFQSVENLDSYQIMMPFVFDGKKWTVSLYPIDKSIDVSDIAKKHGGGGHPGAAGFVCEKLPF